jgi:PH domain
MSAVTPPILPQPHPTSITPLDTKDELFQQSILKIDNDEFYTVHFTEKRPLGVVFERSGEWAIIKSSANQAESGLLVGSVLSKVDNHSVILEGYQDTIDRLKGWQPPLALSFRRAPGKCGYLLKESKSRSNPQKMVWKKRYFVLGEGKIMYMDNSEAGARVKGECPLMGSVVSLVKEGEAGKQNCFRLMSGMMYLTLRCSNEYQMMDWASNMYHAISIANGGAYILQYEIDRLTAHAEDSKAAELALKGVRIPSVRIKSQSKSPPAARRSVSEMVPAPAPKGKSEAWKTVQSTYVPSHANALECANNQVKLEEAMRTATEDDFGDLVKMICHTRVQGINVDKAEQRLMDIKNAKKRRSVDPKTYRMDGEGEDEVQAQLLSIQERNERRKVADASAQLVRVVQTVGYDSESVSSLERAIAQATSAGVSRDNIEKAKKLLRSLYEGKELLDEALRTLHIAMAKRSLPMLIDAVNTASEIGFHHDQLQIDVGSARKIITELKTEALEKSLKTSIAEATVDDYDDLAIAVERARGTNVSSASLLKAQTVLTDLRRKKEEKEDITQLIRRAINSRDLHLLQTSLQSAILRGIHGKEVDMASNLVWEMQRAQADKELQQACDRATPDDYALLERLVAIETSGTAFSISPRCSATASSSEGYTPGERVGAGHSVTLMAYSRLAQLKEIKKNQNQILQNISNATQKNSLSDLDRAVSSADDIGFHHPAVEEARIRLRRMQTDQNVSTSYIPWLLSHTSLKAEIYRTKVTSYNTTSHHIT